MTPFNFLLELEFLKHQQILQIRGHCIVLFLFNANMPSCPSPWRRVSAWGEGGGGGVTRPIFGYGNILTFIAMFGTNSKIHTVLFWNHLLCDKIIAGEQIYVIVIDLLLKTWSIIKFHQANQINHILYAIPCLQLRTDLHKIKYPVLDKFSRNSIPCLGQRGQKPYHVIQQHIAA